MSSENTKRYFQFLLVVLSAGTIYPLIYLRTNYQESMLQVFNMSLEQLNNFYSILGLVFVFGYFPSGLLSDRFSAKKLLAISLFGTSIGGFWFAQTPGYAGVAFIYAIWGFFSVFTFWSAQLKLVKMLAKRDEEGKFFGILDGGRGVVESLLATLALYIFASILGQSLELADKKSAIVAVIYMYSIALLLCSILVYVFVEEDDKKTAGNGNEKKSISFNIVHIFNVFKNKYVYLHGAIIFMGYTVLWTVYYLSGFLETNIKVDPVTASSVLVVVLWMRPIGGFVGGFLADKIGKPQIIGASLAGASICLAVIALLPYSTAPVVFYTLLVILALFFYSIRGTYWSILGNSNLSPLVMGTAIGLVSFIGYLPDIILPQFNSLLFRIYGNNGGYNAYFISCAIAGIIGVVIVFIYANLNREELGKLKNANR